MQIKVSGTGAPYITIMDATYIDTILSVHNFNDTGTGSSYISTYTDTGTIIDSGCYLCC